MAPLESRRAGQSARGDHVCLSQRGQPDVADASGCPACAVESRDACLSRRSRGIRRRPRLRAPVLQRGGSGKPSGLTPPGRRGSEVRDAGYLAAERRPPGSLPEQRGYRRGVRVSGQNPSRNVPAPQSVKPTYILGLSAYYHDSAAALLRNGDIVAAAQEERFTRVKGDARFPHHAIAFCLDQAGITEHDLDYIVFYENPLTKFERLLTTYHLVAPRGLRSFLASMPSWLTDKLWMENDISREMGLKKRVYFCDHHLAHAASAYYPSPFPDAAVLTIDGVGEWSTSTFGVGEGAQLRLLDQIRFPNSVGLLYSAFTYFTGFKINSGEYKLMGLAPYGEPKYVDVILDRLIRLNDDGSVVLNQAYFDYATGLTMTNARFNDLFGGKPREPESLITQREMDLAASVQAVVNEALLRMARHVRERTGRTRLCLAGGVALNVVATGLLSSTGIFDELWIQPAAGDAGGALGAALWFWHQQLDQARVAKPSDAMQSAMLGYDIPPVAPADDEMLRRLGAVWDLLPEATLQERIAQAIGAGKVVALARGRAEFGPRALGARSILGDARSPEMQRHMNLK
ncbi:MAG: hypothetical protein FJ189_07460, partial [Gammaproteobacteria bacterium]|nr:hypothetical protein [Gammaproteobacteria bacterium]